jgi:hypothetical protein
VDGAAGSREKINPSPGQLSPPPSLAWQSGLCSGRPGRAGVLENLKVGPDTSRLAASNSPPSGPCSSHPARLPVSFGPVLSVLVAIIGRP